MQSDVSSNSWRAAGWRREWEAFEEEEGRRDPMQRQVCSVAPTVADVLGKETRGMKQPLCAGGCEDPDRHLRGAKRL